MSLQALVRRIQHFQSLIGFVVAIMLSASIGIAIPNRASAQQQSVTGQIAYLAFNRDSQTYSLTALSLDTESAMNDSPPSSILPVDAKVSVNARPKLSPDGQFIAFETPSESGTNIAIVDTQSGRQRWLTDDESINSDPMWSPDGKQIAFVSDRGKERGNSEIYVLSLNGDELIRVTRSGSNGIASDPSWSPDGKSLLYLYRSSKEGIPEVHRVQADGSGEQPFLPARPYVSPIIWSPDGKMIAFVLANGDRTELMVGDAEGQNLRMITSNTALQHIDLTINPTVSADACRFAWSPDSNRIAYESTSDGNYEIYVTNVMTMATVNVTNNPGDDRMPEWSPDGSTLVFISNRDYQYDIYMASSDGSTVTNLTKTAGNEAMPIWVPSPSNDF